jgi:diaminohydroxyphosphoribosylaminopyrimidine deaminase/5-amino-6-(5-phosphoribosylamino)uracil reductase
MQRCLDLARQGQFDVAPNPMVGCVIVYKNKIVASGYHQNYGEAHAEVNAIKNLPDAIKIANCSLYVNLEPCSHYGKTPPCADLLVAKKPKRVVIGMVDPHKKVAGAGVRKLMEAGINVKLGVLEAECYALNKKFIVANNLQRPFVTLKWAETANGYMARLASDNTKSAKISDILNDVLVHELRASHQAIVVGAHTVNKDNPALNVREVDGIDPIKIILSNSLSVALDANLFATGNVIIYNNIESKTEGNMIWVKCREDKLENVLSDMHSRGIQSVLVEGGANVLEQFITLKLWDEAIILKSNKEWNEGIKAPWIGIPSYKEESLNGNTIKYFKPK